MHPGGATVPVRPFRSIPSCQHSTSGSPAVQWTDVHNGAGGTTTRTCERFTTPIIPSLTRTTLPFNMSEALVPRSIKSSFVQTPMVPVKCHRSGLKPNRNTARSLLSYCMIVLSIPPKNNTDIIVPQLRTFPCWINFACNLDGVRVGQVGVGRRDCEDD